MAAESASAAVILLSSSFGYSLSTTHVATGSIIGTGLGKKGAEVRWNVAGRMATAWVFTLPCAGLVGAGAYGARARHRRHRRRHRRSSSCWPRSPRSSYWRSRGTKVDHNNVNAEWTGTGSPPRRSPPRRPRPEQRERGESTMSWINLTALWKIVVFGLIAGAGLPALFAGGLYALSLGPQTARGLRRGADGGADSDVLVGGSVLGMVLAAIAFLVVLAAIGWGVYEIYQIGHPAPAKK